MTFEAQLRLLIHPRSFFHSMKVLRSNEEWIRSIPHPSMKIQAAMASNMVQILDIQCILTFEWVMPGTVAYRNVCCLQSWGP